MIRVVLKGMSIVCLALLFPLRAQSEKECELIDLVSVPPEPSPAFPITISGQWIEGRTVLRPKLPLEVTIEAIKAVAGQDGYYISELCVRNVGGASYRMPIGRNGNLMWRNDRTGRRRINLYLSEPGNRTGCIGQVVSTYANMDRLSTCEIKPNRTAKLIVKMDVRMCTEQWRQRGASDISLQMVVEEQILGDSLKEYKITTPMSDAVSANAVSVKVR